MHVCIMTTLRSTAKAKPMHESAVIPTWLSKISRELQLYNRAGHGCTKSFCSVNDRTKCLGT